MELEVFLVGGGGAGSGSNCGAGGGAGGVLSTTMDSDDMTSTEVIVGAGGTPGWSSTTNYGDGEDSSFSGLVAYGGGGGGGPTFTTLSPGRDGGSGGGGGGTWSASNSAGGSGVTGQGYDGGAGLNTETTLARAGGGGGGAGGAGAAAASSYGGDGGVGIQSDITGESLWYAGGGGGACNGPYEGEGGSGIGGNGSSNSSTTATDGTANTGSGGGGQAESDTGPGAGGSGIVVIRYLGDQVFAGGTVSTADGYTIHVFTESGEFSALNTAVFSACVQPWNLRVGDFVVAGNLEQLWVLTEALDSLSLLVQPWGLKLGADLVQSWADAQVRRVALYQPWSDASVLKHQLVQRWRDMVPLQARLDQPWAVMESLLVALEQPWAITSGPVQALLAQGWDIKDITPVLAVLNQPWSLAADGTVLRYTVEVLADGQPVRCSHINIEGGLEESDDVLTCEIHPESEAEYLLCPEGAELQVSITSQEGTDFFVFVVTDPRIDESHGGTSYVVESMSPAALLGAPYAEPIDGELFGMASAIAAELAGDLSISWETVDWPIPASTWIASGETPLALLKTMAAAVGAVVQSDPDGTIAIRPRYPVAVPQWATATHDIALTETLDCFTSGATPDHRYGYNRFLVSNQSSSSDGLTLEDETISETLKEVRGYQVPWDGLFDLTHTGGSWVVIEPMGIETRDETETVEFVSGAGSTRYPIYGLVSVDWQQTNLGTITTAEDGSLTSSVDGQSLAEITYTTKCKLWRVTDPRGEQLQLVAEI